VWRPPLSTAASAGSATTTVGAVCKHRKLEGLASQYYTLLKSQLEQQHIYYQGHLEEMRCKYAMATAAAWTSNNTNHNNNNNNHQTSTQSTHNHDWIATLKQEKHQLMQ